MSAPDPNAPDLSALVAARLCHDLISPIGAIGNGLELLQLAGGGAVAELALVNDSLATALAKLRFYRVAFGPADPQGRQSLDEAAQITDAMFHGRFVVAWDADGAELPRPAARLAYLAILCLEKSLPMGGHVRVAVGEGRITLSVRRPAHRPARGALVPRARWCAARRAQGRTACSFRCLRQALAASGYQAAATFADDAAEIGLVASADYAGRSPALNRAMLAR